MNEYIYISYKFSDGDIDQNIVMLAKSFAEAREKLSEIERKVENWKSKEDEMDKIPF